MFSELTPFLLGKLHGMGAHPKRKPYEIGSEAADDYDAGYQRGREVR